jgi:hypothetical protein
MYDSDARMTHIILLISRDAHWGRKITMGQGLILVSVSLTERECVYLLVFAQTKAALTLASAPLAIRKKK